MTDQANQTAGTAAVAQQQQQVAHTVKSFFTQDKIKAKFQEILGAKAPGFMTSVLQLVANDKNFKNVDVLSVYNAAATAAALDLPINNSLGFAWIIPYKQGGVPKAQFQIGAKGFIQLGQRTGQYKKMNAVEVFENQFRSWNKLTEELDADFSIDGEGKVVGYCAFFKLVTGFEKTVYWTSEKMLAHAKRFSKSFNKADSPWQNDFDKMALKTIMKNTLSSWGPLSIELRTAVQVDQAVINDAETLDVDYIDNTDEDLSPEEKAKAAEAAAKAAMGGSK
jgi:recombination protein RecT